MSDSVPAQLAGHVLLPRSSPLQQGEAVSKVEQRRALFARL